MPPKRFGVIARIAHGHCEVEVVGPLVRMVAKHRCGYQGSGQELRGLRKVAPRSAQSAVEAVGERWSTMETAACRFLWPNQEFVLLLSSPANPNGLFFDRPLLERRVARQNFAWARAPRPVRAVVATNHR